MKEDIVLKAIAETKMLYQRGVWSITCSAPVKSEIAPKARRQCWRADALLGKRDSLRAVAKQVCSFSLAAFMGSSSCWTKGRSCIKKW